MFDLKPRVHVEEVEALARLVGARDDQHDRARAIIADGLRQRDALFAHGLAHLFGHEGRRRFLDHLLVASLDAALTLVEVEDVAVLVCEDLDLDMARSEDEYLDEDAVVAEEIGSAS